MSQVLSTFGIDWRLLLINAVNFFLVMVALWYFLYAPVMRMLESRRERVAKGVQDAQDAARSLSEIESSRAGVLSAAGKDADAMVAAARAAGAQKERELAQKGEAAAAALLREAQAQAAEMKTRSIEESKHEVAKLIVLGMEKIMSKQGQ